MMELNFFEQDHKAETAKIFLQEITNFPNEKSPLFEEINSYKIQNQIKAINEAAQYLKTKQMQVKKIELKILIPILDGVGLEEDRALQERWVALLANTANANKQLESTLYSHILSQLTRIDAELLFEIHSQSNCRFKDDGFSPHLVVETIRDLRKVFVKYQNGRVSIDNLFRLNLLHSPAVSYSGTPPNGRLTHLAYDFIQAVTLE